MNNSIKHLLALIPFGFAVACGVATESPEGSSNETSAFTVTKPTFAACLKAAADACAALPNGTSGPNSAACCENNGRVKCTPDTPPQDGDLWHHCVDLCYGPYICSTDPKSVEATEQACVHQCDLAEWKRNPLPVTTAGR